MSRSPFLVSAPKPLRPLDMEWSELHVGQTVRVSTRDVLNRRWRPLIEGRVVAFGPDMLHVVALEGDRSRCVVRSNFPRIQLLESAPDVAPCVTPLPLLSTSQES